MFHQQIPVVVLLTPFVTQVVDVISRLQINCFFFHIGVGMRLVVPQGIFHIRTGFCIIVVQAIEAFKRLLNLVPSQRLLLYRTPLGIIGEIVFQMVLQANISKVTLFSGKVDFTIVGTEHTIEMKPSQELTFNAEKASVKVDEMQGVKWKDGNYEFTNVDLSSWIEIVGRIYNVKISLEHGQATKNLLNGRLRYNESLEEAIEKMCFSTGWRYRKENGEYIIFR